VTLPKEGCDIVGLRIPDYTKKREIQRDYWEWLIKTAKGLNDRPSVLIGDFNTDPRFGMHRCGDCIGRLIDEGWRLASPAEGASFWTIRAKVPCRIDHAFVSQHFTVLDSRYVSDLGEHGFIGITKDALSDHGILWVDVERAHAASPVK
jgi:endonuclease/exonuclease/phosphatase family metal-dependent hydrolase